MSAPRYGSWGPSATDMVSTVTPFDTRGPKRLWSQGPGYVVRRRGAVDEPVALEFMCPTHGRFTCRVSKTDTPDEVACTELLECDCGMDVADDQNGDRHPSRCALYRACGLTSPWSPSGLNAWKSAGEVTG